MRASPILFLVIAILAACDQRKPQSAAEAPALPAPVAPPPRPSPSDPVEPPAPGTPGGLPDDRTPIPEAPFKPESAQGAANVVQTYFALLEAGKYRDAWRLWADGGRASGLTEQAFVDSFAKYAQYHAQVGAPGQVEGAAGSSYVDVIAQTYGRLQTGEPFVMLGPITLRRVNNVPGATPEQLRWRIGASGLKPVPQR